MPSLLRRPGGIARMPLMLLTLAAGLSCAATAASATPLPCSAECCA